MYVNTRLVLNDTPFLPHHSTTIPPLNVETLKLNKTSAELAVGQTLQLEAQITPSDASDAPLTWTSSDKSIVTVVE